MASLFSILGAARDGIFAQTAGLEVTGQNIAGASTPGYVRRNVRLEPRAVAGAFGVNVAGITRNADSFAQAQVVDQSGRLESARARSSALISVESIIAPDTDNLSDRATALFSAFSELAQKPNDVGVRASVLARANYLAQGFSDSANGLEAIRNGLAARATDVTVELNTRLTRVATLNDQIVDAEARGGDASDLHDQRDQLVKEIGDRIGARSVEDPQGRVTLFGAGTVLVEGNRATSLSMNIDASGAMTFKATKDGRTIDVTASVNEGALGGLRESRDTDIPRVQDALDKFAFDLGNAINTLHASGFGLDGASGRNLFVVPAAAAGAAHSFAIDPSLVDRPDRLAASGTAANLPGGGDVAITLSRIGGSAIGISGTPAEQFASLASDFGVTKAASVSEEQLREDTVATASALRESASGVSMDEEMTNMTRFQRGFEAASRVLRTVDELFDDLMRIF